MTIQIYISGQIHILASLGTEEANFVMLVYEALLGLVFIGHPWVV